MKKLLLFLLMSIFYTQAFSQWKTKRVRKLEDSISVLNNKVAEKDAQISSLKVRLIRIATIVKDTTLDNTPTEKVYDFGGNGGSHGSGHTIYTGPRGGHYYINSHGNKTYTRRK